MNAIAGPVCLAICMNLFSDVSLGQASRFLNVSPANPSRSHTRLNRNAVNGQRDVEEHPANFEQKVHSSFHRPNRSMNHHSNTIRKERNGLNQPAVCLLVDEMANGLGMICVYNCHGHPYTLQADSGNICAQSAPEKSFGN